MAGGARVGVGENMLEEAQGGGGGKWGRKGREGGGEAAAAKAAEQDGKVALRIGGGHHGERAGKLRGVTGGVSAG